MTKKKVWLITGAGRGLGLDITRAVLVTGDAVVATGRDAAKVEAAVGRHENMLPVTLDVTRPQDAQAAVERALAKFERIDVLVNNAGNFFAGRRGYHVRGTVNKIEFESVVVPRAKRFFVLVTDEMSSRARLRDGSKVTVSLRPVA